MPTQKINKTKEIIDKIFKDHQIIYGLKEFDNFDFENILKITEEEKGKSPRQIFSVGVKERAAEVLFKNKNILTFSRM